MYDWLSMKKRLKQILTSWQKISSGSGGLTEAAVLIPIFCKDKAHHIIFTQRSHKVPHHKGQVSFPGGARSPADSSLLDTALRESWEEIGLEAKDVEVLGELDDYATTSGYNISPFVGFIPYPYEFRLNPYEIDDVFSVPVSVLLRKADGKQEQYTFGNQFFVDHSYEYEGRVIWGATAQILQQLLEIWKLASGAQ